MYRSNAIPVSRKRLAFPPSRATLLTVALLAVLALPLFVMFPMVAAQGNPSREDRAVLVELYEATGGMTWENNKAWNTNQPLDAWYGVRTNDAGRVTHLELPDNNLVGTVPVSLRTLSELVTLNLRDNRLTGQVNELGLSAAGKLQKLETLDLSNNDLEGHAPPIVGGSIQLGGALLGVKTVKLSGNQFTGGIVIRDGLEVLELADNRLTSIPLIQDLPPDRFPTLLHLDLSGNQIVTPTTGPMAGVLLSEDQLNRVGFLETLDLSDNLITGNIPDLSHLPVLERGDLSHNQLSGNIPDLSGMLALETLDLSHNMIEGALSGLEFPFTVKTLDLSHNQLIGNIPDLSDLLTLETLDLSHNEIEGAFSGSEVPRTLETLDLSHNELSGAIPDLTDLTGLLTLDLSHNRQVDNDGNISGGFGGEGLNSAYDFGNLPPSLTTLDLSHNRIFSINDLPGRLLNLNRLTALVTLDLSHNRSKTYADCGLSFDRGCTGLMGELEGLESLNDLETLDLSHNYLDGALTALPTSGKLRKVDFSNNRYAQGFGPDHTIALNTGLEEVNYRCNGMDQFDLDLSPLVNLKKLDFSCNAAAENAFPQWIARMTSLTDLRFADSRLTGRLPDLSRLQDLDTLRLWGNELTGGIGWLNRMPRLYTVNLHGNQLSGPLPNLSRLTNLHHLSLHDNGFTGNISRARLEQLVVEQADLEDHPGLEVLNLSGNAGLSGTLNLERLDTAADPLDELDVRGTGITLENAATGLPMTRLLTHEPPCANDKTANWPPTPDT